MISGVVNPDLEPTLSLTVLSPAAAPSSPGIWASPPSSANFTPSFRRAATASRLSTYVRSGRTTPGEWRRRMGRALSSSRADKRMTTFMVGSRAHLSS